VDQNDPARAVNDPILRFRDVEQATGLSRTTIWRERLAGRFPRPVQLTAGLYGWRASDLNNWLETRLPANKRIVGKRRSEANRCEEG
jgi:prophage regulatory protein